MSVDYRGLRLIEQVLEAEERRDGCAPVEDFFHREYLRLSGLLWDWVAEKFNITVGDGETATQDKVDELLSAFRA